MIHSEPSQNLDLVCDDLERNVLSQYELSFIQETNHSRKIISATICATNKTKSSLENNIKLLLVFIYAGTISFCKILKIKKKNGEAGFRAPHQPNPFSVLWRLPMFSLRLTA